MNIKILDSWLKDYLKTDAKPTDIANTLSLTSVGVERIEKWKNDYLYDIEITTNRPDLASVIGIAREAAAVLPQFGFQATGKTPVIHKRTERKSSHSIKLQIHNDPKLVNRLCAVVLEVTQKPSPKQVSDRLESSDIRSLNNLVDITNYVMRTIGYPAHVFDYDRLNTKALTIREAQKGEMITTLDGKEYMLPGGDIIAVDDNGRIVDLLGIMGLENSVVTDQTKRIVLFINNNDPHKIRKTSMGLGIRTEAAQLNEKKLDSELVMDALLYGISLYEQYADGKVVSDIIDNYPTKPKAKTISLTQEDINNVLGITLKAEQSEEILRLLGFKTTRQGQIITAEVPSFRLEDVSIREDLIEEIARVYGYQNIPNVLPPFSSNLITDLSREPFYWEARVKQALKYWGFTEVYTYPMVSETLYEGDTEKSVRLKNPLGEDFVYMRRTLVPSLLAVTEENKKQTFMRIFEIGNVYEGNNEKLPLQTQHLAIVLKEKHASFFEMKGIVEQLAQDLAIPALSFKPLDKSGLETEILIGRQPVGTIEVLDENLMNIELDFELFIAQASLQKTFTPLKKYPPVIEDISLEFDEAIPTGDIIETISRTSSTITDVSLLDKYGSSRTFHILYQRPDRNLTVKEVGEIREKILQTVKKAYGAKIRT